MPAIPPGSGYGSIPSINRAKAGAARTRWRPGTAPESSMWAGSQPLWIPPFSPRRIRGTEKFPGGFKVRQLVNKGWIWDLNEAVGLPGLCLMLSDKKSTSHSNTCKESLSPRPSSYSFWLVFPLWARHDRRKWKLKKVSTLLNWRTVRENATYRRMKMPLAKPAKWVQSLTYKETCLQIHPRQKKRAGKDAPNLCWGEKTISTNRRKSDQKKDQFLKHCWVQDKWESPALTNKPEQNLGTSNLGRGPEPVLCSRPFLHLRVLEPVSEYCYKIHEIKAWDFKWHRNAAIPIFLKIFDK